VLTYKGEGHEAAGQPTSDLVFKIKELPHDNFKRKGQDLIYTAKISLMEALCSEPVNIVTLDTRYIHIPIDEVISPKYVRKVPNEGMPIPYAKVDATNFSKPLQKGDLYIRFEIEFPKSITEDQKKELKQVLGNQN